MIFRDEAGFQTAVARLATQHEGVLHYHTHDSRRSEGGFPDSCFVGRAVMFRELKMTVKSRVRPLQKVWIARLDAAGADAGFWYAQDYESGLIEQQLSDLAPRDAGRGGRRDNTPMALRLAKRLYLKGSGVNPAKADLLWESGIASVSHGEWIARAQEVLAIVATELPASADEHLDWLARHELGHGAGLARVFAALRSDLAAPANAEQLLLGGRP